MLEINEASKMLIDHLYMISGVLLIMYDPEVKEVTEEHKCCLGL